MDWIFMHTGLFCPKTGIDRAFLCCAFLSAFLLPFAPCLGGLEPPGIDLDGSFTYGTCETPAPDHELDYFQGIDTTFATSSFLSYDLPPFPPLAGQTGNLILTVRAPPGREIVVSRDCTLDIRFGWNPCFCSTTNGTVVSPTIVELLGASGPPPGGVQAVAKFEAPAGSAPPELGDVLFQYNANVLAGFRFSGIRFTTPIDPVATSFPTIDPLDGPTEARIQSVRILPGDQRPTEGDPVAEYELLPVSIELTQIQPMPGVEVLTATCATYQLEFAHDPGVSDLWSETGAAVEGDGELQVLSDPSGESGSKTYRVVVVTD